MNKDWSKYIALKESGSTAREACLQATADGLSVLESMSMLNNVYGLVLTDGKALSLQARGMNKTLEEYQCDYIVPIIEEAERQGLFDDDA